MKELFIAMIQYSNTIGLDVIDEGLIFLSSLTVFKERCLNLTNQCLCSIHYDY